MTDEAASASRRPRFLLKVIGAVLLLVLIGLALYVYQGRRGLAKLRAELIAEGEVLDWRVLGTNAAPHQSNGMPDLAAASRQLSDLPRGLPLLPEAQPGTRVDVTRIRSFPADRWDETNSHRTWVSNLWTELRPHIDGYRHAWQLAIEAETNEVMLHENNWTDGLLMKVRHHHPIKTIASWSRAAVAYELQRGAAAEALGVATNAMRILHRTEAVPTYLGEIMRQSALIIIDPSVWWLLQRKWDDSELASLQLSLDSISVVEPALRALELDRAQTIQSWEKLLADPGHAQRLFGVGGHGSSSHSAGQVVVLRLWQWGPSHHDLGWYLQSYQADIDAFREAMQKKSYRRLWEQTKNTRKPPWIYLMSRHLSSGHGAFFKLIFRGEARLEIVIAAVALHRFRLRHGEFPESLNELVPDLLDRVPVDWMDGQILRYQRKSPDQFRLWSVGEDGVDQGGDPRPPKRLNNWWMNGRDYVWPTAATPAETRKFADDSLAKWKAATATSKP